jgi:hypothetical protein
MTITPQSRYLQGSLLRLPNSGGTYNLSVVRSVPAQFGRFNLYVWQETDRPDIVANNLLGNPALWWSIFDINPEIIYPLNITPGTVVRIPIGPIMGQGTLYQ